MKTKLLTALAAGLALAGCKYCDMNDDPVIGNWGLKLSYDAMSAAHMIVSRTADGKAEAFVLWRWASPIPMTSCEIRGNHFTIEHPWGFTITGSVKGNRLMARFNGKENGTIEGWRNPPIEPASTADAKFGEPIDLLADGLDGWEAMDANAKFGWSISEEDGVKVLSNCLGLKEDGSWAGGGANLKSKREDFYDFNLDYDVRVPKGSNSGVYLRGRYEIQTVDSFGQPVNEHNMAAYYGRVVPAVAAEKKPGEWQHVNVTLYKRHITVILNDVKIIDDAPVTGITGGAIDANEFVKGPLYLQGDHSDADYKNMILRKAIN